MIGILMLFLSLLTWAALLVMGAVFMIVAVRPGTRVRTPVRALLGVAGLALWGVALIPLADFFLGGLVVNA
ncbi:MAG: hypothetical protein WAV45_08665 [Propionibacteriaceae bacterium]|nr:hypothetical protein [Micropruina sp.]HBX81655.1 hypothetical protein [Propionibacteriaceae bacterium]HBY24247.1 hypothetical protein [Propionibacteriaceae bacterium]